ncbi:MAG: Ger(x)C family spore germination protein [Bacilli bacterium]
MKRKIKLVFFLITVFNLTGCYNYKEINTSAIVSAISIDINDKKPNEYEVGVQIMNAKKTELSTNSLITFYKATDHTIYGALQSTMLDSPKELYLGHNGVIIINEELLKQKDPLDYLDFFMRDAKTEKDSIILVAKDCKAYNILKIITPLETLPSQNLKDALFSSSKYSGITNITTTDQFISYLINDGEEAVLPSVRILGKISAGENMDNISDSDPDTKLVYDDLAVLKNNRLSFYMNVNESIGYNIINNDAGQTYINFKCGKNNYGSIKISSSKTHEKISFKNNKPFVKISNKISADLIEYNCKADFLDHEKSIHKIEKQVENKIKKVMNEALNTLYVTNKSDALKYGSKFYKMKNNQMKKLNYTTNNIKNDISFKTFSNVKIKSIELSIKSPKKEKNNE